MKIELGHGKSIGNMDIFSECTIPMLTTNFNIAV